MNHTCSGDWCPTLGYYRCLLDGAWLAVSIMPETCPNCKRPATPVHHVDPQTREVVEKQVLIEEFGWMTYATDDAALLAERKEREAERAELERLRSIIGTMDHMAAKEAGWVLG